MAEVRRIRLGELLVDAGLLQPAALERALELQKSARTRLGKLLVAEGMVDESQLTQILSHQLSVPWVSLHHIEFSRQLLNLVPAQVADAHDLVPIYVRHVRGQGQTLYLAMEDPQDEDGLAACRSHSGLPVRPMIASPSEIRQAIQVYYGVAPRPAPVVAAPAAPAAAASVAPPAPDEAEGTAPSAPAGDAPTGAPAPSDLGVPPEAPASPAAPAPVAAAPAAPAPAMTRTRGGTLTGGVAVMRPPAASEPSVTVELEEGPASPRPAPIPEPAVRGPRMVALTLLDGTTIQLPARKAKKTSAPEPSEPPPARRPGEAGPADLTARDLVSALRAVAHGADATEVLGDQVRWEAMFAAMLSLLLKKHLIADWEFVEEYRKHAGS